MVLRNALGFVLGFTCVFIAMGALASSVGAFFIEYQSAVNVVCGLVVIAFGVVTSIAGLDLGSLWNMSDFANIVIAYCNIPLLYIGFKYVKRATRHFDLGDGTPFTSDVIGIDVPLWDEKAKEEK